MEEDNSTGVPTPKEPPMQPSHPEFLVASSHAMQATCNKSRVLLQVVPVTLYGACGQLNTHALLDPGSTCSLIRADIADQLIWMVLLPLWTCLVFKSLRILTQSQSHLTLVLLMNTLVIWWKVLWLQRN